MTLSRLLIVMSSLIISCNTYAEVINVPADYPAIQTAINAAQNGDTILVAPGTYNESNINFNGKDVVVRSASGPEVTILDTSNSTDEYCFQLTSGEPISSEISGFTITGSSKGIRIVGSSATIHNCTFQGGTQRQIHVDSVFYTQRVLIDGCRFFNQNVAGESQGVIYFSRGQSQIDILPRSTIQNCVFTGIEFNSGGSTSCIRSNFYPLEIEGSVFTNNTSQNICEITVYQQTSSIVSNCDFRNNNVSGNIFAASQNDMVVADCTFESNQMTSGSTLNGRFSEISNCFVGNNSSKSGISGLYLSDFSTPVISNTRFCENDNEDIFGAYEDGGGNEFLANCNDVEGACCVDEVCYEVERLFCDATDGTWLGYNVTCEAETCAPQPQFGACCVNGGAVSLFDYDCDLISGWFAGEGTTPDDVTCPTACLGDANADGTVDVNDILDVVAQFGVTCP